MTTSAGARNVRLQATLLLGLFMAMLLPQLPAGSAPSLTPESVIVQSFEGARAAAAAVQRAGGEVIKRLPIVGGVSARVTKPERLELERDPAVLQVSTNDEIGFQKVGNGNGGGKPDPQPEPTPEPTPDATPTPTPSPSATAPDFTTTPKRIGTITRGKDLWSQGITGKGVTVALIDTGVYAAHPDLSGRVIHCEDFSHEAGTEAHCADTFGHGTFMAGLIAGNGASSGGTYMGSAPEANIVSVKLAGFDGSTDVSNVLAGIQWVVAHKSLYGIKVLNLSLGTDSTQSTSTSPLNYAVQRAWKSGITVIVSSGNSGDASGTVLKPADDPLVVTVGSSNDEETLAIGDDRVPVFSSRGPTRSNNLAKPDLVAPGVRTVSLRSPGSAIDQQFGASATVDGDYFRGTGTSMSTAVVTGIAAQILQANPTLVPDQVKYRLTATSRGIADTGRYAVGAGIVDAYAATKSTSTAKANQNQCGLLGCLLDTLLSSGLGFIEPARGSLDVDVETPLGVGALLGEYKAQYDTNLLSTLLGLIPWASLEYTLNGWTATSWHGTSWHNAPWAGTSWHGTSWHRTYWGGTSWHGTSWHNSDWAGTSWHDVDWEGTSWHGTSWHTAWYAVVWD
ncbi:MAG: S8 family peptidase [Actinomycetota bacterium]